jgi:pimeloyl-ACP methyl ester carboxylesterase
VRHEARRSCVVRYLQQAGNGVHRPFHYGDGLVSQLQDELADLSADSTHVVAVNAGHHVHCDDPGLVIQVVADLVRHGRRRGRPGTALNAGM